MQSKFSLQEWGVWHGHVGTYNAPALLIPKQCVRLENMLCFDWQTDKLSLTWTSKTSSENCCATPYEHNLYLCLHAKTAR